MIVSAKKHNQLVTELAEANLDMQRYIKELENTVKEQFDILNKMYNCDPDELVNHQIAHYTKSLIPIQYEEE